MVKGDDAIMRKKNKLNRKKQRSQNDKATVSGRIAAIIASKKRRLNGKRRMCQGMCYSLPTLEDPFNDGHKKPDLNTKKTKKPTSLKMDIKPKKDSKQKRTSTLDRMEKKSSLRPEGDSLENIGCPSKFLVMCLNSIEGELRNTGLFSNEEGKPLFVDKWGVEFWKCYLQGKDVLETCCSCSTVEQIAWIASTAADDISRKEKDGLSLSTPSLLLLVPTQEKAIKVRSVCKPLKGIGIHTVSLHAGASVEHQILGLKSSEPEFLVSTPERLLELISSRAVDISGVSLLVVDGLEMLMKCGWFDITKSIMQLISNNHRTVVFNDSLDEGTDLVEKLLHGKSIHRLSSFDSVSSQELHSS